MKRLKRSLQVIRLRRLIGAAVVALTACSPAATSSPSAVGGQAAASSGVTGSTTQPAQSWEQILAAAKKEGEVNVGALNGEVLRRVLTAPFEAKYGIKVQYQGSSGSELGARVTKERAGGLYQWDVFVAGTDTMLTGLKPIGALAPIEPGLILPEVKDPKNWLDGKIPYFDQAQLGLSFTLVSRQSLYLNTDQADARQFTTWRVLLDPKWNSKILVGRDPRVSGYGQATFFFFYLSPSLGPDFLRQLVAQNLKLLRDDHTSAQWLAEGKYPMCICSYVDSDQMMASGLPVKPVDPRQMAEGSHVTSSNGNVALASRAPHPNAAIVYLNWLLSQEEQSAFVKASGDPSQRVDVPTDGLQPWILPQPGWVAEHTEEMVSRKKPFLELLDSLLPH